MTRIKKLLSGRAAVTVLMTVILIGAGTLLMAEKEATGKGFLGVSIEKVSPDDKDEFGVSSGVLVTRVTKDEAADKAGIKKYDVIQYFNEEKIRRPDDLMEAVRECKPGAKANVKLVRDGKKMDVPVTLGEAKHQSFSFSLGDKDGKDKFIWKSRGHGFLGVYLQELNKDLAEYFAVKEDEGALILNVEKDGPADKAGLKAGDVIVKMKNKDISKPGDVSEMLEDMEKGDKVEIQVMRHKKKQSFTAEVDESAGFHGFNVLKGIGENFQWEPMDFHISVPHMKRFKIYKDGEKIKDGVWHMKEDLKEIKELNELKELDKIKKLKKIEEYTYI